jgi:hypothetical protein
MTTRASEFCAVPRLASALDHQTTRDERIPQGNVEINGDTENTIRARPGWPDGNDVVAVAPFDSVADGKLGV